MNDQNATYDDVFLGFRFFVLRKKLANYDNSLVIPETEWRQCYAIDFKPSVPFPAPLDSQFVFLRKDPNILCYDMESSKMRLVQYVGHAFIRTYFHLFPDFNPEWPPSPFPIV